MIYIYVHTYAVGCELNSLISLHSLIMLFSPGGSIGRLNMEYKERPFVITLPPGLLAFTGLMTALFWILFFSGKIEATET